ncbi:MAG TPA: hypothetical protein VKB53_06340, partial [Gammaproteobacteria bacterium]|nr:hypothetical protein [Gammaproteobacteria bacterium]
MIGRDYGRKLTAALAAIAITALILGCNSSRNAAQGPEITAAGEMVLRKGNGAEPQTLDPHRAQGVPEANILRDLYEGLVSEAPGGKLEPGVAASWEISADG